jgi:hypothetical protein
MAGTDQRKVGLIDKFAAPVGDQRLRVGISVVPATATKDHEYNMNKEGEQDCYYQIEEFSFEDHKSLQPSVHAILMYRIMRNSCAILSIFCLIDQSNCARKS